MPNSTPTTLAIIAIAPTPTYDDCTGGGRNDRIELNEGDLWQLACWKDSLSPNQLAALPPSLAQFAAWAVEHIDRWDEHQSSGNPQYGDGIAYHAAQP